LTLKGKTLFSLLILLMFFIFLFILESESGFFDLRRLKRENSRLVERNLSLEHENRALCREIDRLKNDMNYIENIARRELGMIRKDEVIIKLNEDPARKSR
jgi:cell division protein FtsB